MNDPALAQFQERLERFEESLNQNLARSRTGKDELERLLSGLPKTTVSEELPDSLQQTVQVFAETIDAYNKEILNLHKEWLSSQELEDRFEDHFLLVVVGRVNMGKSTFCNVLADILSQGLGRNVQRFVLQEPSRSINLRDLDYPGREAVVVHPPWAREALRHEHHEIYTKLRNNDFVLEHELTAALLDAGYDSICITVDGPAQEREVKQFETGVLETTLEFQGLRCGRLCLLDAPGLCSGNPFASKRAQTLWRAADMVIFLTCQSTPLQATDLGLLGNLSGAARASTLFCVTMCDQELEDEHNGETFWTHSFNEEAFQKQEAFVRRILQQQDLEGLLIQSRVLGVSSRLYDLTEAPSGPFGVPARIREGHFEGLMEALSQALAEDGLRRKALHPLERALQVARQVDEQLEEMRRTLQQQEQNELYTSEQHSDHLEAMFSERVREAVLSLVRKRATDAKKAAMKNRRARLSISSEEIEGIMDRCAVEVGEDFEAQFRMQVECVEPPVLEARFKEIWVTRKKTIKTKVKRGFLKRVRNWWHGKSTKKKKSIKETVKYEVRQGDNFKDEERRLMEQVKPAIEEAALRVKQQVALLKQAVRSCYEQAGEHICGKQQELQHILQQLEDARNQANQLGPAVRR